jgi:hypothetical protein
MIIRNVKKYFFTYVVPTFYGGGSGGGQNTTVQQRNIPKELAPYYEMLMGAATKQTFTTAGDKRNPPITISPFATKSRDYSTSPYKYGEDNSNMSLGYAEGGEVKGFADGGATDFSYQAPNFANATGFADPSTYGATSGMPSSIADKTGKTVDITGIQPWKPYGVDESGNVDFNQYVAPQTALQNQANTYASQLAMPEQGLAASDLANIAGTGAVGTVAQGLNYGAAGLGMGNTAADIGTKAAGAGEEYAKAATSPDTVAAYMNPFLNQSLQPQLDLARQEADITTQRNNSQAAQAGAYGGSRQAVQKALTDQGLALNEANIIGKGYTDAFNNANTNMQFGANLGLQGAQTGIQGQATGIQGANTGLQGVNAAQSGYGLANTTAGTLGNLGTQELANQRDIISTQNQLGTQQQAMGQQAINNAIQANSYQQTYPWQVLGNYANMLNGVQAGNVSTYTPAPSPLSGITGALAAGAGAYMANKKKGGVIKKPKAKSGGIGDLAVYNAMKGGK